MNSTRIAIPEEIPQDKFSRILIWILVIATLSWWAARLWATYLTDREAAPLPQQFGAASGQIVMTRDHIVAGKSDFQQPDLMDYGSLYGMRSYFGEE
jgi:nitric oxide reductase subunit B